MADDDEERPTLVPSQKGNVGSVTLQQDIDEAEKLRKLAATSKDTLSSQGAIPLGDRTIRDPSHLELLTALDHLRTAVTRDVSDAVRQDLSHAASKILTVVSMRRRTYGIWMAVAAGFIAGVGTTLMLLSMIHP